MVAYRQGAFATVVVAVAMGLTGCGSSEAIRESGKESATTVWVATVENGDKPGNGYQLVIRDRRVIAGKFYLLDPNKPHDLKAALLSAPFEDIKHSKSGVTFTFTLKQGDEKLRLSMTMSFLAEPTGKVGTSIRAKAKDQAPNSADQELQFVRRE